MTPQEFVAKIRGMSAKLSEADLSPALEAVATGVWESVGRNFTRQVDSNGSYWPPRRDKLPHPLLRLTLAMSTAATGGPGSIKEVERRRLKLGIDTAKVHYWRKHHDGEGNVPRRRYFYLHTEDKGGVRKIFVESIKPVIRRQVLE